MHVEGALQVKVTSQPRCHRQKRRDERRRVGTQRHIGRDIDGADLLGALVEFHCDGVTVGLADTSDQVHEGTPYSVGGGLSHSESVNVASISPLWFNQNMNHLVIYNKKLFGYDYIAAILHGDKKLGCKFRKHKTVPYQKLQDGDYIYLKESSGPVRGRVRVTNVQSKELIDPEETMDFLASHSDEIGIESEAQLMEIWKINANKRYLCFWTMETPEILSHPVHIQKNDRQAWVINYKPSEEVLAALLGR